MKTTRTRRRPTTLKACLLGLGLGFGATLTTTMALETECDVCHVNYFHKVYIIIYRGFSFSCDVAADCDDDDDVHPFFLA